MLGLCNPKSPYCVGCWLDQMVEMMLVTSERACSLSRLICADVWKSWRFQSHVHMVRKRSDWLKADDASLGSGLVFPPSV
jgi:hypothetical protein